jgi:plasmid stabilization system protein ParE
MTKRLTRRELGMAAVAAGAAVGRGEARLAEPLNSAEFDPVRWTMELYAHAPLRLTFRATNKAEAEAWQRDLRAKLTELMGGFPERTPLKPRTVEVREFPKYRRERFVFEGRPGSAAVGYLLLARDAPRPCPVAICVPGHGRGVDDIVGID